jgi:hypothetical protein
MGGLCDVLLLWVPGNITVCGSGVIASGSGDYVTVAGNRIAATFDWKIEA